jgi:hypothetical protein
MKSALTVLSIIGVTATTHAATLWVTTFSGTNNTSGNASRTITNTPTAPFTDTLATTTSALTRNITGGNFFLTGTNNGFNNYNPNQNVDNASNAGWNAVFDFNVGTATIDLTDITFRIYRFNSSGATQATDGNNRTVNLTTEYTLDGSTWNQVATSQAVNLTTSVTGNQFLNQTFTFASPLEVDLANDDFSVRFTVANDNQNSGAFLGINSITFNGTVVPEPTAALLGSFGLLPLLRRRR